jgi:hypothetical protein
VERKSEGGGKRGAGELRSGHYEVLIMWSKDESGEWRKVEPEEVVASSSTRSTLLFFHTLCTITSNLISINTANMNTAHEIGVLSVRLPSFLSPLGTSLSPSIGDYPRSAALFHVEEVQANAAHMSMNRCF